MLRRYSIISFLLIVLVVFLNCKPAVENPLLFQENFDQGYLDQSRWEITRDGDFSDLQVDVFDAAPDNNTGYRLRLRANTIGTSDPLKYLGIRSRDMVDFNSGKSFEFDLDWNNQANGCYLTASFYLCPTISQNPNKEPDWLAFEYNGVPPGVNVRTNIWEQADGFLRELYADWGPNDEKGRPQGRAKGNTNHHIQLIIDKTAFRFYEDGKELYSLSPHHLNFTSAYIYLQMSSGTNYPSRQVYFDNILVQSGTGAK